MLRAFTIGAAKLARAQRRVLVSAVVFAMSCGTAVAQGRIYRDGSFWVEETTGTMTAGRSFKAHMDMGSITYSGGASGNTITYVVRKRVSAGSEEQARRVFEAYRITARSGDVDVLSGDVEGDWRRGSVHVAVTGPRQQQLVKVSTDGGDVGVMHIEGRAEVNTDGGNVNVDDIVGTADIETGGGNAHVGLVKGDLQLRSGGGNVDVDNIGRNAALETGGGNIGVNRVNGDLAVTTGGGSITVKQVGGHLKATTGGGALELGNVGGAVTAETGGGSIRLSSGAIVTAETGAGSIQCMNVRRGIRAETGTGAIVAEFTAKRGEFTDSRLEAGMGDIIVYLPADLAVTVRAAIDLANGHSIQSEFNALKVTQSEGFGPQEVYAEGALNGGGPTLKLHTTNGNISLRRLKKIVSSDDQR